MTAFDHAFRVAFLVFPGIAQLDLTGPYEVFSRVPGARIDLHWKDRQPVAAASGLSIAPTATFDERPAVDLVCVPGGPGQVALMTDDAVLDWLRGTASRSRWITSVCTGSLLLGAAGLLRGYRATCHWSALAELPLLGATPCFERVVVDRDRITGAGVTSGIDFALNVVGRLLGRPRALEIQLAMQYEPAPPWPGAGSPRTAATRTLRSVHAATTIVRRARRAATLAAAARLSTAADVAAGPSPSA